MDSQKDIEKLASLIRKEKEGVRLTMEEKNDSSKLAMKLNKEGYSRALSLGGYNEEEIGELFSLEDDE